MRMKIAAWVLVLLAATQICQAGEQLSRDVIASGFRTDGSLELGTSAELGATSEMRRVALEIKSEDIGIGDPNAKVHWIEYASAGCSHCATVALEVLPVMKAEFIDTGKVYYVLRDFPRDNASAVASLLARCMPRDQFYAFMDVLFSEQNMWHGADVVDVGSALLTIAERSGLRREVAEMCLADQSGLDRLRAVVTEAAEVLGVNATPTSFINGDVFVGALAVSDFRRALANAVAISEAGPAAP